MRILCFCCWVNRLLTRFLDYTYNLVALAIRWWMFSVFFNSACVKLASMSSTLLLFKLEYKSTWLPLPPVIIEKFSLKIPSMPYELAAYLGTGMELVLPCLFLLGIGGRVFILMLFVFNYIALVSYPLLWSPEYLPAFKEHIIWGLAISVVLFKGYGCFSLDQFIRSTWCDSKSS